MLALLRQECPDYFPSYPDAVSEEAGAGGLDILRQAGWSSGDGGLHAESKLEAGKIMMKFGVHPVRAAGLYLYTCPYTTLPAGHMQSELASPGNSPRQMREEAMGEEKTKQPTESETHAGLIGLAEGDVVVATLGTAASVKDRPNVDMPLCQGQLMISPCVLHILTFLRFYLVFFISGHCIDPSALIS